MSKGFFSKEQSNSFKSSSCDKCGLYKKCISPKMKPTGEFKKEILICAEAPGTMEDKKNTQLIGEAGQLLEETLKTYCDINLHTDCRKINAVNCRPPRNRTPTNKEIMSCRPMLINEIKLSKPKVIILLGATALKSFMTDRWKKNLGQVNKWRGWAIPDRETGAWVIPTYHPSYMLRNQDEVLYDVFCNDLKKAINCIGKPFTSYKPEKQCIELLNTKKAFTYMEKLYNRKPKIIAFDFETTGLKPHRKEHKILTVSICDGIDHSVSFILTRELWDILGLILSDPKIGKIASNMKYETTWTKTILGFDVEGWKWDTMLASHILDNRGGITGLKFQAYVNFGIIDYASHLDKFIVSDPKEGGNGLNKMMKADVREVLYYCAMDSLLEFRLAKIQVKQFGRNK